MFNCITTQNTKDGFESKRGSSSFFVKCSNSYLYRSKIILFCVPILGELSYPRLRVLLQFDTQEFLNVLSMVSNFMYSLVNRVLPENMLVIDSLKLFLTHLRVNSSKYQSEIFPYWLVPFCLPLKNCICEIHSKLRNHLFFLLYLILLPSQYFNKPFES